MIRDPWLKTGEKIYWAINHSAHKNVILSVVNEAETFFFRH